MEKQGKELEMTEKMEQRSYVSYCPRYRLENIIRIYKKNEDFLFKLTAFLAQITEEDGKTRKYILSNEALFHDVIKGLEDREIIVRDHGKAPITIFRELSNKIIEDIEPYVKEEEYREVLEKVEIRQFDMYFHDTVVNRRDDSKFSLTTPYNLMNILASSDCNPRWIRTLLTSKIPMHERCYMLDELLCCNQYLDNLDGIFSDRYYTLPDSVTSYNLYFDGRKNIDNRREKLTQSETELWEYWKIGKDLENHFFKYLICGDFSTFQLFESRNFLGFDIQSLRDIDELGKTISFPAIFYYAENRHRNVDIKRIEKYYDTPAYLKVPKSIRENNDAFLIRHVAADDYSSLPDLISFKNFSATVENLDQLEKELLKHKKDKEYAKVLEEVGKAIINKSSRPKEFRKNTRLVKNLQVRTDPQMIAEVNLKRELARNTFVQTIATMNSSLLEQVPATKKIKDIQFVKTSTKH